MIVFALSSIDWIGWGCGWPQTDVKLWRCKVLYSCRFYFALSAFFDKSGVSQLPWVVLAICLYYFLFSQSPDQVVKTPYVCVACEQVLLRGLGLRESQKAQVDGRVGREGGEVPVTLLPLPWEPIHKCLSRLQLTVYYFVWCKVNVIVKYQTSIKSLSAWRRLICNLVLFANAFLVFRVRYHAARGLIYLGCMDVGGVYLFKRVPGKVA